MQQSSVKYIRRLEWYFRQAKSFDKIEAQFKTLSFNQVKLVRNIPLGERMTG